MDAKTTSQKHAELRHLGQQAKANIYRMLQLANEILLDHGYVDGLGGEAVVLEQLEKSEFAHFGGNPALGSMLRAYRCNPHEDMWVKYRYNIRAMIELSNPPPVRRTTQRVDHKRMAEELQLKNRELQLQNERIRRSRHETSQSSSNHASNGNSGRKPVVADTSRPVIPASRSRDKEIEMALELALKNANAKIAELERELAAARSDLNRVSKHRDRLQARVKALEACQHNAESPARATRNSKSIRSSDHIIEAAGGWKRG